MCERKWRTCECRGRSEGTEWWREMVVVVVLVVVVVVTGGGGEGAPRPRLPPIRLPHVAETLPGARPSREGLVPAYIVGG